jgi:hypothetical protein
MGFILENIAMFFWQAVVHALSEGKPWYVWVFWTLSPIFILAVLIGLLWLLLSAVPA